MRRIYTRMLDDGGMEVLNLPCANGGLDMNWLALVLAIAQSPLAGRIFDMLIRTWQETYGDKSRGIVAFDTEADYALQQIVAKLEDGESHE